MPNDARCVLGCLSGGALHNMPEDPERATAWRQRLDVVGGDSLGQVCCERHFSDDQFERFGRKKSLKADAVPDCNLPAVKLEAESFTSLNNNLAVTPEVIIGDRFKEDSFASPPVALENLDRLCRLCLETDEAGTHLPLFGTEGIVDSIQQSIGIELSPGDPYPKQICPVCVERVNYIQRSREWFQKNDHLLKTLVPEVSETASDDLIIPDVVPETEAIFFKEESGKAAEEIDDKAKIPKRKTTCPLAGTKSKSHKKRVSSGRPNSFCTLCSRVFTSPRELRRHLNWIHQGVCCKHCRTVFSHTEALEMHIKQHHGELDRLEQWKQDAAKNLFQEMAEKFNEAVAVPPLGEGSGWERREALIGDGKPRSRLRKVNTDRESH